MGGEKALPDEDRGVSSRDARGTRARTASREERRNSQEHGGGRVFAPASERLQPLDLIAIEFCLAALLSGLLVIAGVRAGFRAHATIRVAALRLIFGVVTKMTFLGLVRFRPIHFREVPCRRG